MNLMSAFEFIGTVAFAFSGAIIGIRKEMDIFGAIILAITTAIGGGIFRDIIVGILPPTSFVNPTNCFISIATAIIVFVFYNKLNKLSHLVQISDAIGLGAFTAIGGNVALHTLPTNFMIVSLGLFTGVGGGILRDVFAKEIPFVFKKEIYAVASILGGISFIFTYKSLGIDRASYICFFATFVVRIISIKRGLHLPVAKVKQ
ncbi:putative membrane protein YeiH [Clostridium pascui]|nr:putative membrane protein YeiH [Clostridium pascui]